jgi:hypothetical protein
MDITVTNYAISKFNLIKYSRITSPLKKKKKKTVLECFFTYVSEFIAECFVKQRKNSCPK